MLNKKGDGVGGVGGVLELAGKHGFSFNFGLEEREGEGEGGEGEDF